MTTTAAIDRCLAESKRLFPGHNHDGAPHVTWDGTALRIVDTVGTGEIDAVDADALADALAELPEGVDIDRFWSVVSEFFITGTETW